MAAAPTVGAGVVARGRRVRGHGTGGTAALVARSIEEVPRRIADHQRDRSWEHRRDEGLSVLTAIGYALAPALAGWTPGQQLLLGVRLVDRYGDRPTVCQEMAREVVLAGETRAFLHLFLPDRLRPRRWRTVFVVGTINWAIVAADGLWPLTNVERRGLRDRITGTSLVRDA